MIAFGRAMEVEGAEKEKALLALVEKYAPQNLERGKEYIKKDGQKTKVLKIAVEHFSGKALK